MGETRSVDRVMCVCVCVCARATICAAVKSYALFVAQLLAPLHISTLLTNAESKL
jgi:hypothetical protein